MPNSASAGTRVVAELLLATRGMEASHTDMATSAATAKASVGEGIQPQNPGRPATAATRARSEASNHGDGEITGRSSSAPNSARKSSARLRQLKQMAR